MNKEFPGGVWPTMITPFTVMGKIDYAALEEMIEWYVGNQVDGLFAVCQSSEMFLLSLEERVELAGFVNRHAAGRIPVIASGHISDRFEDQVKELNLMAETGVQAVILITNRLARQEESDEVWLGNLERLLQRIPEDIRLGFYECPYPYKRIISPNLLKRCADTGRFFFLKDTSCDVESIREKIAAVRDSRLQIYNANSATLLETLKLGVAGYSGVMANFHPNLYHWLFKHWSDKPEEARYLSDFLSIASLIERQLYPANAKYYQELDGVHVDRYCRTRIDQQWTPASGLEVEQLYRLSKAFAKQYGM